MSKIAVGIDVSKATFDVALLVPGRSKPSQTVFDNTLGGFQKLESWLQERTVERPQVCMESTGIYGQGLATYLVQAGFQVSVVNPARIKVLRCQRNGQEQDRSVRCGPDSQVLPPA